MGIGKESAVPDSNDYRTGKNISSGSTKIVIRLVSEILESPRYNLTVMASFGDITHLTLGQFCNQVTTT